MSLTSFYDVLGVAENATKQEIGQGYRKLAASLHADRLQDMPDEVRHVCEERLKQIGEAYDVLERPELREKYDRLLAEEREKEKQRQQAQQAAAAASASPPNPVNQAQQPSSGPYYGGQAAAQPGPASAPVGGRSEMGEIEPD